MHSVFNWVNRLAPSSYVLMAVIVSAAGIGLLLGFILMRRFYRHRYFQRLNRRIAFFRDNWEGVVQRTVPAESWRLKALDREIMESILLDRLEDASPIDAARLTEFLQSSGLLDHRLFEARKYRGWRRRKALLSLGRMRMPQVIPVLSEALEDPDGETRLIAVRSLGRTELPEAAEPIIQYIFQGLQGVAVTTAQNALLRCCHAKPAILLPYIAQADDTVRPFLVRVLGEFVSPEIADDLVLLTTDKVAEVRASAARSLRWSKSAVAVGALGRLIEDPEWFVRLRAVAAMGHTKDPTAIPPLAAALCDENRLVRLRAAEVLSQFENQLPEILRVVMQTRDVYALQAFVSQIQRMGTIPKLIDSLGDLENDSEARMVVMNLLQSGSHRMLLDALAHHPQSRVRAAVANLMTQSSDEQLLAQLETLQAGRPSEEQQPIHLHGAEEAKKVQV